MKRNLFLLYFFTLFGSPLLADQIPYIYTNGGPTEMNLISCVSLAKKEMRLGNFTRDLEVLYDSDNSHSATIFSSHSYKPVSITYRCMTNINTWTFGIGSLDNKEAWDSYEYFYGVVQRLID